MPKKWETIEKGMWELMNIMNGSLKLRASYNNSDSNSDSSKKAKNQIIHKPINK